MTYSWEALHADRRKGSSDAAPAGVCVDVGEQIGGAVCGATARRKRLPEILHIRHCRILAPRGHVGVYHIA